MTRIGLTPDKPYRKPQNGKRPYKWWYQSEVIPTAQQIIWAVDRKDAKAQIRALVPDATFAGTKGDKGTD